jgi:ribosomal protein L12E/L44/L45/RPP1/RPP2
MQKILITLLIALTASGCDMGGPASTTTKLDAVEVEPGTASDAMILLDDSDIDGTAVDNSAVLTAEGQAAAKAEAAKAAPTDEAAAEGEGEADSESETASE